VRFLRKDVVKRFLSWGFEAPVSPQGKARKEINMKIKIEKPDKSEYILPAILECSFIAVTIISAINKVWQVFMVGMFFCLYIIGLFIWSHCYRKNNII